MFCKLIAASRSFARDSTCFLFNVRYAYRISYRTQMGAVTVQSG